MRGKLRFTNIVKQLRDTFDNKQVLELMKTRLKLLPFVFDTPRLEEFMQHQSHQLYLTAARDHASNRKKGQYYQLFAKNSLSESLAEAYVNYLFNEKQEDVICSRQIIQLSDLTNASLLYPEARKLQRRIIYHHGPTNSGKTSAALEALKDAKSGVYMAPLRLLAWQTQQKLMPCSLVTGQEKQIVNSGLTSCTIETVDLGGEYDVAIIDEIQMMADEERGWAWTQALLATKSPVIHLCGEGRSLELVSKLVEQTGDTLEERTYTRFSKLHLLHDEFDMMNDLQPGDCIIAFSSQKLYALRNRINRHFGKSGENLVAIIYGKLPPEVRKRQAQLFNEGTLPFLVSTNAIGMGLNLKIKKVIFSEIEKKGPGRGFGIIQPHLIQQIAGRAGRGLEHGYVQALSRKQLKIIRKALKNVNKTYINLEDNSPKDEQEAEQVKDLPKKSLLYNQVLKRPLEDYERQLKSAGMFIGYNRIERLKVLLEARKRTPVSLSNVFHEFMQAKQLKPEFVIQRQDEFCRLADLLEGLGLCLKDHYNFAMSPVDTKKSYCQKYIGMFAKDFATSGNVTLPEEIMRDYRNNFQRFSNEKCLRQLQEMYQIVELYIWLANKYEMAFSQLQEAIWAKGLITERISRVLDKHNSTESGLEVKSTS